MAFAETVNMDIDTRTFSISSIGVYPSSAMNSGRMLATRLLYLGYSDSVLIRT